jgi:hypothetical protein
MSHRKPWTLQRNLVKLDRYDDSCDANLSTWRPQAIVAVAYVQSKPISPPYGNEVSFFKVHPGGSVGGHHGQSGLYRNDVYRLPLPVQNQHLLFEYAHSSIALISFTSARRSVSNSAIVSNTLSLSALFSNVAS